MASAAWRHDAISPSVDVELSRHFRVPGGALGGRAQIGLGHEVRVHVVVDDRRVLVGAGDAVDAEARVGPEMAQGRPESCRLDEQFDPVVALELTVTRDEDVAAHGVGDGGVHVERGRAGRPVAGALLTVDRAPREGGAAQAQLPGPLAGQVDRGVPPDERRLGDPRHGVGEDRQDQRLGVPEGMAVVAGAGEALCRDGPFLGTSGRLEGLEEAEADGLLQRGVTVDLDVGSRPEVVQVLPLGLLQSLEPPRQRCLQTAVHLIAQPLHRLPRGPVIGKELDQPQRTSRRKRRREGEAAQVRLALDERLEALRRVEDVLHPRRQ